MTRHSRNCTAGTVYTYHERQKDQTQSGYGSKQVRIGKDSVKVSFCVNIRKTGLGVQRAKLLVEKI